MSGQDELVGRSGRWEPNPRPLPEGTRHDVRFFASGGGGVNAECRPCHWGVWVDDGHTAADFAELERQHTGEVPETTTAHICPEGQLLAEIQLVLDRFAGRQSRRGRVRVLRPAPRNPKAGQLLQRLAAQREPRTCARPCTSSTGDIEPITVAGPHLVLAI
jgi:hypothetical protein